MLHLVREINQSNQRRQSLRQVIQIQICHALFLLKIAIFHLRRSMQLFLANPYYEADLALGLSLLLHKSLSLAPRYNFTLSNFTVR